MSLKVGKPNPLNYFDLRRADFACPHFKYTSVGKFNPTLTKELDVWIRNNLNGRYFLGSDLMLDHTNTIVYITRIGFEVEKELSYFKIAAPQELLR